MSMCTVCSEPSLSEGCITHGVCTDCYRLNFAGAMQAQAPRREQGEDTLMARQREAMRLRVALRQWTNRPEA
ncbi:MAG TPA: hypothetical protein VI542_23220 [Candidatus Tectomicrobia bacterium]